MRLAMAQMRMSESVEENLNKTPQFIQDGTYRASRAIL